MPRHDIGATSSRLPLLETPSLCRSVTKLFDSPWGVHTASFRQCGFWKMKLRLGSKARKKRLKLECKISRLLKKKPDSKCMAWESIHHWNRFEDTLWGRCMTALEVI